MGGVRLLAVNGVLLAAIAGAIVWVQVSARAEGSVEAGVRRYAAAVSNADLDSALAEIAPERRGAWADFVRNQLGNVYDVKGIAVRSPSLIERLARRDQPVNAGPFEVTVVMDVNRDYPSDFYQPTTRVPVEVVGERPYLAAPLLAPR
jgi:hypothetical protein